MGRVNPPEWRTGGFPASALAVAAASAAVSSAAFAMEIFLSEPSGQEGRLETVPGVED